MTVPKFSMIFPVESSTNLHVEFDVIRIGLWMDVRMLRHIQMWKALTRYSCTSLTSCLYKCRASCMPYWCSDVADLIVILLIQVTHEYLICTTPSLLPVVWCSTRLTYGQFVYPFVSRMHCKQMHWHHAASVGVAYDRVVRSAVGWGAANANWGRKAASHEKDAKY